MALPSTTFTEMVTTALRHQGASDIADNVSDHNALLNVMKRKGKIKTASGGYEIQIPIEYAENSTFQRYTGYEQLDTSSSDVLTSAKYEWKQSALHVTASGREIRMNMGSDERLFDLVEARIQVAKHTAANNMSVDIYSDGTASNQIGGLGKLITNDGTGEAGGITAGAAQTWWKNQFKEMTGTDTTDTPSVANAVQMKGDMNALWLTCVRGTDKPDVITMTHDVFSLFELGEQDKQRYSNSALAKAGFETIQYKSAAVVFDDNTNFSVTGEKAFFVNTDFLYLIQHRDAQWSVEDSKTPVNQDAVVVPLYWQGNMCCSNRNVQGVLIDAL